ncbi:MAG: hypothetical protein V4543_12630 [Bacteroidota bacterium]
MRKLFLLLLIPVAAFWGCADTSLVQLGPDVKSNLAPLTVISPLAPNKPELDFTAGDKAWFTAKFSRNESWHLRLLGNVSLAEFTIDGKGTEIAAWNSTWDGSTTKFPVFQSSEQVLAFVSFDDTSLILSTTVFLKKARTPDLTNAVLLSDFEGTNLPAFPRLIQADDSVNFGQSNEVRAAQGSFYYSLTGVEAPYRKDYFIGYVQFPASLKGQNTTHYNLIDRADSVWFNVFVYGAGRANTQLAIQFQEDDVFPFEGTYDSDIEDQSAYNLQVTWTGWKLVSFRYSETLYGDNQRGAGKNGNRVHEPNKISNVQFSLITNPPGHAAGQAVASIDFPVFTIGAPFRP